MADGRPTWDDYFLMIAKAASARADCRRRKVGCVIVDRWRRVVSTGYNGAPAGQRGCLAGGCPRGLLSYEELAEHGSYDNCVSIHAEANALLYAHQSVRGFTAYVTDDPCPACRKLLVGAGIERIVIG